LAYPFALRVVIDYSTLSNFNLEVLVEVAQQQCASSFNFTMVSINLSLLLIKPVEQPSGLLEGVGDVIINSVSFSL